MQRHSCKEREELKRRSLSRRVHAKRARLQFQLSALAENSIRRGSSCFSSNGLISNYRDIYLSWRVARSQGPRSKLAKIPFSIFLRSSFVSQTRKMLLELELGKQSKIGIGCKYIFRGMWTFVFKQKLGNFSNRKISREKYLYSINIKIVVLYRPKIYSIYHYSMLMK